jgi:hypothetical protein
MCVCSIACIMRGRQAGRSLAPSRHLRGIFCTVDDLGVFSAMGLLGLLVRRKRGGVVV